MRVFLGMVLGAVLTVAVAYVHDLMVTSPVASGNSDAVQSRTLVNWDVFKSNLRVLDNRARQGWATLDDHARKGWTKLSSQF